MKKHFSLFTIFLIVFTDLLGFGIVIPYLPSYAKKVFAAGDFKVGLLMASFSFMQFLFAPIWGGLSDRIGRRPILVLSLSAASVSYWILGIAPTLGILFLSRLLAGAAAANISTAQAVISDTTTPENRAKGMGMIGAAFGLGFIFGPAIGGALSHWSYSLPAYFGCGLSALAMVLTLIVLPETLKPGSTPHVKRSAGPKAIVRAFSHPHLSVLFAIFFLFTFVFSCYETTFPLLAIQKFLYSPAQIGFWFAYVGVLTAIIQGGLIGRLAKKWGERKLIMAGLTLTVIGTLFIPFATGGMTLASILLALALGSGITSPSLSSFISLSAGSGEQGGVLGMSQSLSSLARILGPVWGGLTMQRWGFQFPYVSCAVILAIGLAFGTRLLQGGATPQESPD
ncbi:MAG: MFS transporter [Acidobacteriia bacterium]|nr:MFS transporter [Terriglobia bacterium]